MKRMTLGLMAMVSLVLGSAACGGGPPPKPAEEPIDTKASPAGASTNTNTAATEPPPASTADTSAASASTANSAADPSAGFTAPAGTTATPPAGKGGKPAGKGGKEAATPPPPAGKTGPIISAADCSKLTDKYVELVISGEGAPLRGTSGKELEQAREMVKASAASDPNFINMQKACVKEIHRSQYTCGMNARSAAEWQDCIR